MSLITQRFNGGTNGAAVTQSPGTTNFTLVNPNGNANFTHSNARVNPLTGGLVGRSISGSGAQSEFRHDRSAANAGGVMIAFRLPAAAPTGAGLDFIQIRGTRQNGGVRFDTDGSLKVLRLGTAIGGAATWSAFLSTLANEDIAVFATVIQGTTASNGRMIVKVCRLSDLANPVWTYDSGTTLDFGVNGTDTITSFRGGKITSAAVPGTVDWYGFDADDGAAAYLPNPSLASSAPSGTLNRVVKHTYDFTPWVGETSVAAVVTSGYNLTIEVNGLVVSVVDTEARDSATTVQFTVTGPGGSTVVSDTIPVGGASATQVIERVVATAATGNAADWA